MQAVFTPYNDKSSARRGFLRKYKGLPLEKRVDELVIEKDGKWGYTQLIGDDNAAKLAAKPAPKARKPKAALEVTEKLPEPEPKPVTLVDAFRGALVDVHRDAELDAALEQHDESGEDLIPDAFSRFAFAQLGAASNKAPEPAKPLPSKTVQKDRAEQNGVKHPSEGTICDQVWVLCQNMSGFVAEGVQSDHSKIATLSQVVKAAEAIGINKYTARTQYARWRTFNGLTGRLQTL